MAKAFLSDGKYRRVKEAIGLEDPKKFAEEYLRIGGIMVEGTNEEIKGMHKFAAIYDAKKPKKTTMAKKKKGKKKK